MLQEILLSLSGHRSPLWEQVKEDSGNAVLGSVRNYLAPSERALLAPLANLSDLHIKIREHSAEISSSHPSMVCRAVASSIFSTFLTKFRQKILEVEKLILIQDARYVGAYGIVPLSTVVGEFAPWTRRLEWLWKLIAYVLPPTSDGQRLSAKCTGADTINFLEKETYTGYSDLEDMATKLLEVAQRGWMRQSATWILYGKLPSHGGEDFCIENTASKTAAGSKTCTLINSLIPKFVSPRAAGSMLSIGESLQQLRSQTMATHRAATDPVMALLPASLAHLNKLTYPLSSAQFASTMNTIRLSISQNALSQLLPLPKVLEILDVIQDFQLLGRGEFATALIANADTRIARRSQEVAKPVRKAGRLDGISVKEAETSAVLSQTFSDLASLQKDNDDEDEILEKARETLRLVAKPDSNSGGTESLVSTLLPVPTSLELHLPKDSALSLFLSSAELRTYASINSYLISLRRAELHLSSLWKLTPLRRCYPTPLGPPSSARPAGQRSLATQREREAKRTKQIRKHWAAASKVLYVLNELGAYFQGEVILENSKHFRSWIDQGGNGRPTSPDSTKFTSRPGTAAPVRQMNSSQLSASTASSNAAQAISGRNDPVVLAQAHRLYLRNLSDSLLLGQIEFIDAFRNVLTMVDHFVALFTRIQSAWQGPDLQEDDGVVDALSDYAKEERDVLEEMTRSGTLLDQGLSALVERIGRIEHKQPSEDMTGLEDGIDALGLESVYVPRRVRTIDRLIMKLDVLDGAKATDDGNRMYESG